MNILVTGGGGREHALVWKLRQSPGVGRIFVAPGNAGTEEIVENAAFEINRSANSPRHSHILQNVRMSAAHPPIECFDDMIHFCQDEKIDLVVVGPDDHLAGGIVDSLQGAGIKVFGPTKRAAEIEWSKAFAKSFMQANGIPTARFAVFSDAGEAKRYLKSQKFPIVIKTSGLALGKGVVIASFPAEARQAITDMMEKKKFGEAGAEVVIEEHLIGREISIHAFCDGETAVLFPPAQDHKRAFDGDRGPNTGGMGTIAPVSWVTPEMMSEIEKQIVLPALQGLAKMGRSFIGILFPGLMITADGPKVLEFNARFGDPEAQSYMRLLKTDLLEILLACVDGKLANLKIKWEDKAACCVVLASGGYPGAYQRGFEITGLNKLKARAVIFQAGTKRVNGILTTNGGRVLGVTATGADLKTALARAYAGIERIHFKDMHFRRDIGAKSV